jgi:hypothetical protein
MSDYELRRRCYKNEILSQQLLCYEYGSFYFNHVCCGSVQLGEVLNLASVSLPCVNVPTIFNTCKVHDIYDCISLSKKRKTHDFQGDVVTGKEVAHSKFFKLS